MTTNQSTTNQTTTDYPDTIQQVLIYYPGSPNEQRIETGVTLHLLRNNNGPILNEFGEPLYVTLPED